jgi:transcriptional regulator with XRE-family HTH domain
MSGVYNGQTQNGVCALFLCAFAEKSNLNKVTLNRLERGEGGSLKLFIYTIQKLGISLENFFHGL